MIIGILAAVLAALSYGTASVLQARGAQSVERHEAAAPTLRSTITAMLTASFLAGMALDAVGFTGSMVSARLIPLFLSQTIISANLAVTAVLAVVVLHTRLSRRDWTAIGVVVVALVVLSFTAGDEGHEGDHYRLGWMCLLAALGLFAVAHLLIRQYGDRIAIIAGLIGGVLFGMLAIAVRIVPGIDPFDPAAVLTSAAFYAILVGGGGGFYLFTIALQTGSVQGASAAIVVGETVIPGVVGILVLGDTTRPGWGIVALIAFIAAVAGAVTVASSPAVPHG
ncbi:hypothetical protein AAFP30_27615 [Gordonia sp. CPCC 205515]|uniref:hypothetical protein n=1 Tax=Gordonia sp. CPCC 205515 TaxID=3140791 RepID=UPI003AF3CE4A